MAPRPPKLFISLVMTRQIRAGRMLAGLTQAELFAAEGQIADEATSTRGGEKSSGEFLMNLLRGATQIARRFRWLGGQSSRRAASTSSGCKRLAIFLL